MKLNELCKSQREELKETLFFQLASENMDVNSVANKKIDMLLNERYGGISFVNDDFFCTMGMETPRDVEFIVKSKNGRVIYKEEKLIEQSQIELYAEGLRIGASLRIKDAYINIKYIN